ncbi:MAG TPA: hypothetical protein VEZ42_12520 [Pseudonocardia sp.]|nr:hypothetical protein [Pseudonocardia sp.]
MFRGTVITEGLGPGVVIGAEEVRVSGRVFRYRAGEVAARDEAVAYGPAAGTPEQQLDRDR